MRPIAVKRLTIYPLALRMKRKVSHAVAVRSISEPVVVCVELMDGATGYGETLPRSYVTGESTESVVGLLGGWFTKRLLEFRCESFFEALEAIEELPFLAEDGAPCSAARASLELALLDAYSRSFDRAIAQAPGWMGLRGFGEPGSMAAIRYSGVLASESVRSVRRNLRLMRLYGIRDFKLKVGFPDDDARLAEVSRQLSRPLQSGRASLRLDANGAWSLDEAVDRLDAWRNVPVSGVEQPLAKDQDGRLGELKHVTGVRVFHDESLVTLDDAERLHQMGVADGFNIRISKCGGLLPALRLAAFARQNGVEIQLGCMVGETSILSAAGVRFLQMTPGVRYAEGAFGRLLMAQDVCRRGVRFHRGGRPPRIADQGLGCSVDQAVLEANCVEKPTVIEL